MPKAIRHYTRKLKKQFACHAAWPPSSRLSLGDYGTVDEGIFTLIGNLADLSIPLEIAPGKPFVHRFLCPDELTLTPKPKGIKPPHGSQLTTADAGFHLRFERPGSFLFAIDKADSLHLSNTTTLQAELIRLADQGAWNSNYLFVSSIVRAEECQIIVSYADELELDLKLTTPASPNDLSDLLNPALHFTPLSPDLQGFNITDTPGATPLFELTRLSHHEVEPLYMQSLLDFQGYTTPEFAFTSPILLPDHLQKVAWDTLHITSIEPKPHE